MFKYVVFFCLVAAVFAEPGILAPAVRLSAGPAILSAPVGIIRSPIAPIGVGVRVGVPLGIGGGLISGGLIR